MLKTLDVDAGYSASKRCDSWLKVQTYFTKEEMFDIFCVSWSIRPHCLQVKRDYVEGLGDSLDLVPIGAWYGNGRKAGW
jgi:DNA ligase-1